MAVPSETELVASTLKKRFNTIYDAVSASNAVYYRLRKKGRIKPVDGGTSIVRPVEYAENQNFAWYTGYDNLPMEPQEVISTAEVDWKQCAASVVISGREQLQNSGQSKLFDLLEAKIENAEKTMVNGLNTGLLSDGTGSGGKVLTGLDAAVPQDPTTGTYAGISRVDWTFWRSKLYDTAATLTSSNALAYFNAAWIQAVRGDRMPDLIVAGATVYAAIETYVDTNVQFSPGDVARVGFPSIRYKNADIVYEAGMDAEDAYFLNTDSIWLHPHKDRNLVPLDPKRRTSFNQDAEGVILAWAGNLFVIPPDQLRLKGD